MNKQNFQVDFAISYAGEDSEVAEEVARRLRELGFIVFFAGENRKLLLGIDGEAFFERLFSEAKDVVVFISQHYKRKIWIHFEWDIILERNLNHRYIPIHLDKVKMIGLPSNILYLEFDGSNYNEIIDGCIYRLLLYEKEAGIRRPSEYETILEAIRTESKGTLAKAYQLMKDNRERDPLEDCEIPVGPWDPSYRVVETEWCNFSKVKRRSIKILVPPELRKEELILNLKHCAATQFNAYKPDAIMVLAYREDRGEPGVQGIFDAGRAEFAPFGDWGRAMDGFAYNIPTEEFEFEVTLAPSYFDK